MSYERDDYMRRQEAEHDMIRMRETERRFGVLTSHPDPRDELIRDLVAALEVFARIAEVDVGLDETDADKYQPLGFNRAPHITIGDLRRCRDLVAFAKGGER